MLHRCKITIFYDSAKEAERVFSNPLFTFVREGKSKYTGEPVRVFDLKNTRIKYFLHSKRVRIDFNFQEFRNLHNKKNPSHNGVCFVADYISAIFHKSCNQINITYLEYAFIISVGLTPCG